MRAQSPVSPRAVRQRGLRHASQSTRGASSRELIALLRDRRIHPAGLHRALRWTEASDKILTRLRDRLQRISRSAMTAPFPEELMKLRER